jgi:hypothetical protein
MIYTYDIKAGRYRGQDGRFVSFVAVRNALDASLDGSEKALLAASESLQLGQITLGEWQQTMARATKDIHLASTSLAKGGWSQMASADYGRVGGRIAKQYRFLQKFAQEIEDGYVLDGRFLNRVKLYAQSGRLAYHATQRAEMALRGKELERSRLAPADHCKECVEEHDKNWQPIGSVKLIGTRQCLGNCRCVMQYK